MVRISPVAFDTSHGKSEMFPGCLLFPHTRSYSGMSKTGTLLPPRIHKSIPFMGSRERWLLARDSYSRRGKTVPEASLGDPDLTVLFYFPRSMMLDSCIYKKRFYSQITLVP